MTRPALLLDEPSLQVLPSLVRLLGDHVSALTLQQIHFRSRLSRPIDGHQWAVQTTEQWCADLIMSPAQFKRIMRDLGESGLIVTMQPGKYNRVAWRRVDFDRLDKLMTENSDRAESDLCMNPPDRKGGIEPIDRAESDRWKGRNPTDVLSRKERSNQEAAARTDNSKNEPSDMAAAALEMWISHRKATAHSPRGLERTIRNQDSQRAVDYLTANPQASLTDVLRYEFNLTYSDIDYLERHPNAS